MGAYSNHEPYESYAPDIGFTVGYVSQLNGSKGSNGKRKFPIGFVPPVKRRRRKGEAVPGTWPEVGRL